MKRSLCNLIMQIQYHFCLSCMSIYDRLYEKFNRGHSYLRDYFPITETSYLFDQRHCSKYIGENCIYQFIFCYTKCLLTHVCPPDHFPFSEMSNSLTYLTRVKPRLITKEDVYVDDFNRQMFIELFRLDLVRAFEGTTRSLYSIAGHYANLWKFDIEIISKPNDTVLDQAIKLTKRAFNPLTATSVNIRLTETVLHP